MGSRAVANERLMKLHKRLFKNQQSLVAKKLKFVTKTETVSPKTSKLPRAKAISKKPPTKFQEFRLSHQKPKSRGRRTLIEELYKTAAAARQTLTGHKRLSKATAEEKRAGD